MAPKIEDTHRSNNLKDLFFEADHEILMEYFGGDDQGDTYMYVLSLSNEQDHPIS